MAVSFIWYGIYAEEIRRTDRNNPCLAGIFLYAQIAGLFFLCYTE